MTPLRPPLRSMVTPQAMGLILLLGATLATSKTLARRNPEPLRFPLETIGRQIGGFEASDNPALPQGVLHALDATSYLSRTYSRGGLGLDVFIAFYSSQRAGESMHSPKHCLPGSGWEISSYGTTGIAVNGRAVTINQYGISRDGERRVVLYWYQSKGRIIASEYLGKLLLARDALLERSTAASIVRIVAPDNAAAIEAGRTLAGGLIPELQHCLGG